MLRNVKRPYKKKLVSNMGLVLLCDYDLMNYMGQIVTVTAHYGPFRAIQTSDGKTFYGVGRGLLESKVSTCT